MKQQFAWSKRVYGLLLKAYPKAFREDYAQEMLWCFEDMCRAAFQKKAAWGMLGLWLRVLPDWGLTVLKEHLINFGHKGAKNMDTLSFNKQYTSTLALFSRALRAGYNVKQAFEIIAEHAPEPTKSTFLKVLAKLEEGKTWFQAFDEVSKDAQSPYFDKTHEIFKNQIEEGGNLADRIDAYNREIFQELGDEAWAKQVELEDGYKVDEHYPIG